MIRVLILLFFFSPVTAIAQSWYEPQRGTAERAQLMNALRPFAEDVLGPPVEFVVYSLRVSGAVAFASVTAQRPGGGAIDPYSTPAYQRGAWDPEAGNLTSFHGLYIQTAQGWRLQHASVDAQDVWWSDPALCATFRAVTPEVC